MTIDFFLFFQKKEGGMLLIVLKYMPFQFYLFSQKSIIEHIHNLSYGKENFEHTKPLFQSLKQYIYGKKTEKLP